MLCKHATTELHSPTDLKYLKSQEHFPWASMRVKVVVASQSLLPELKPQDSQDRRELTPTSCPSFFFLFAASSSGD